MRCAQQLAAALAAAALASVAAAQVVCTEQLAGATARGGRLHGAHAHEPPRRKPGPARPDSRSIAQCSEQVDAARVPDDTALFNGVPVGGVVAIVQTAAWVPVREAPAAAAPSCTGVFIGARQVLSAAHCVYHLLQRDGDERYWTFGESARAPRFLYAVAGKASRTDGSARAYELTRACIPESYANAASEVATSAQGNDLVVFTTSRPFDAAPDSHIATLAAPLAELPAPSAEYILPQYPHDTAQGHVLVVDASDTPIYVDPLPTATGADALFHSVNLVSWTGSSGAPMLDVAASRAEGRPVVRGVLMSAGWTMCDSGIVVVDSQKSELRALLAATGSESQSEAVPSTPGVQGSRLPAPGVQGQQLPPPGVQGQQLPAPGVQGRQLPPPGVQDDPPLDPAPASTPTTPEQGPGREPQGTSSTFGGDEPVIEADNFAPVPPPAEFGFGSPDDDF